MAPTQPFPSQAALESGAQATIVVAGGVVTTVTITTAGTGYKLRDQLSALASNIGGTGTGFVAQVAHFSSNQTPVWDGVHDDTPFFQKAFAQAQNTGQAVLVPDGCWISTLNSSRKASTHGWPQGLRRHLWVQYAGRHC